MSLVLLFSTQITSTGGIENHLVRFCERLSPAGVEIVLLCPDYRPSLGLHQRLRDSCKRLIVLPTRKRPSPIAKLCWILLAFIRLQPRSFASLYLNGQGSLGFWVWKFCGWRAQRCVVHHHSSGELDDISTWPPQYRQLLQGADSVIGCSIYNSSLLSRALSRSVSVIYCFSNPCYRLASRSSSSNLAFGFIGRLIPEKGIDTILRLSLEPNLASIRWHLWGSLDGYSNDFASDFANVAYHGLIESSDGLSEAMQQIDAFTLFSTHREGLPLSLLEAMSAGVPWIASDRGGIRDLIINQIDTILLPQSFSYSDAFDATQQMADNLFTGLTDPDALVRAYRTHFEPDVLTNKWRDLLS